MNKREDKREMERVKMEEEEIKKLDESEERRAELFRVLVSIEDTTKRKTRRIRMTNIGVYTFIDYAEEHPEISNEELIRAVAEAFQVLHGCCILDSPLEALKYREGITFGKQCAKRAIEIIGADVDYRVREYIRPYDITYHLKERELQEGGGGR